MRQSTFLSLADFERNIKAKNDFTLIPIFIEVNKQAFTQFYNGHTDTPAHNSHLAVKRAVFQNVCKL